jgi:hypothetical protein
VRESPSNSSASASTVKEKAGKRQDSPAKVAPDDLTKRELTASPHEARELIYGPGGLFGPKGPFSTPSVRYPFGMEVGLSTSPKRNVHFESHASRTQQASRDQFYKTQFRPKRFWTNVCLFMYNRSKFHPKNYTAETQVLALPNDTVKQRNMRLIN